MIGIDTNVLVRFLVQDDTEQSPRAVAALTQLTTQDPGYLTTVVLVETYWVLHRAYRLQAGDILSALEEVMAAEEIVVQDASHVSAAIAVARSGADFADALISSACRALNCHTVLSFDVRAQQSLGFAEPAGPTDHA